MTDEAAPEKYAWAVNFMRRVEHARDVLRPSTLRRLFRKPKWPPLPGAYRVGDPSAAVAICTLTDSGLMEELAPLPGVAIVGRVFTANLGIERIVLNLTARPNIRFLLLCGPDSPLFRPGQTLLALARNGLTPERRIIDAEGYLPVLAPQAASHAERFREHVEVVDRIGETDPARIASAVAELVQRNPRPVASTDTEKPIQTQSFRLIRIGGHREPLAYDPKGFFVIGTDRKRRELVVHHFLPDNQPAHELRGRSPEAIMLGMLKEGLVSQLSHAAYLGGELAKAETAVRLDLAYEQDRPLTAKGEGNAS